MSKNEHVRSTCCDARVVCINFRAYESTRDGDVAFWAEVECQDCHAIEYVDWQM